MIEINNMLYIVVFEYIAISLYILYNLTIDLLISVIFVIQSIRLQRIEIMFASRCKQRHVVNTINEYTLGNSTYA